MSRFSLARRSPAREIMDEVEPPQAVMDEVCWFLGLINRWLGGTLATLRRFDAFARGWRPGEQLEVLDVACGGGDLARALIAWGRARGVRVRVTALDISPRALVAARRKGATEGLRLVVGDVHRPPCPDGAFDYVTCTLFLHHLGDDEVVTTLRSFARLARRGIVINDLVRGWRHLAWSWILTRPFNEVLRHDGPLSVRRAFRPAEIAALTRRSGVEWLSVRRHIGHRLTVAGERPVSREAPVGRDPSQERGSGSGSPLETNVRATPLLQ